MSNYVNWVVFFFYIVQILKYCDLTITTNTVSIQQAKLFGITWSNKAVLAWEREKVKCTNNSLQDT